MQSEARNFAISLLFLATATGAVVTVHLRSQTQAQEPVSVSQSLPPGTTRAQVLGSTPTSGGQARKPYLLVEFGDYQCPPCRAMQGPLQQFVDARRSELDFAFRNYPLMEMHPAAFTAALYAEAAREQGKFRQMHELLYTSPDGLAPGALNGYAKRLHLDTNKLHLAMRTTAKARVRADLTAALDLKLEGTPALLLCSPNGQVRAVELAELQQIIPR